MADNRTLSAESGVAPFETLFHDFDLEAFAFFNYWTPDEATNDTTELENRDVNDMPRFVKLAWNPAPDLPEQAEALAKLNPNNKTTRPGDGSGVVGSRDTFIVDGVVYSPQQLDPADFKSISTMLVNSDIAPGVINSVVTLPLAGSGITPETPAYSVDLDAWYSSPSSDGVNIGELRNTVNNRTSGYANLSQIYSASQSPRTAAAFDELFSGQFTITPTSFASSKLLMSSVNASSPSISMNVNGAMAARKTVTTPVESLFNQFATSSSGGTTKNNSVKVNFVDTGIGNAVSSVRVNAANEPSHANSLVAVSQVVGNLISYSASGLQDVVRKITLKSFPAPANVATRQYIGYIIEKYEQVNGVFKFKELIGIGDPYADSYYDTKVVYGGVYRYRIRSVMRWVRPTNIGARGNDPTVSGHLSSKSAHQNTSSTTLTPNLVSYFGSEWSKNWAGAQIIDDQPAGPPDQLTVRPQSSKSRIIVTFELPDNSQRDIFQMTLWRRMVDSNGRDMAPWERVSDFDMSRPGYYEDMDVLMDPQVPPGTQLVGPPRYVYAATCVSVHNGESLMSEQIGARLNPDWARTGEHPVEFLSSRGIDRLRDQGAFSVIPTRLYKTHIVAVPENTHGSRRPAHVILEGQERWGTRSLPGNSYILRAHSLDTGETFDIDFETGYTNLEPQRFQVPSNIYIPSLDEEYIYDTRGLVS